MEESQIVAQSIPYVHMLYKFIMGLLAFVIFRRLLVFYDKILGIDFKEDFKKVREDGKAFATYSGMRLIAISILVFGIIL